MSKPLRLILGGTFDPPHNGHLALALAASQCFDADVWLLPNGRTPHRAGAVVDAATRADLVALMIADQPRLHLDRRELAATASGYSVDTLLGLRRELGDQQPIAWIIGSDALAGFNRWHRWRELSELAHWVIASRPGSDLDALDDAIRDWAAPRWIETAEVLHQCPHGRLYRLPFAPHSESSTQIRARLAADDDCRDQLALTVADAIQQRGLYRKI